MRPAKERETLTSKERVRIACSHRETDRVPLQLHVSGPIWQQLADHFGGRLPEDVIGIDLRPCRGGTWRGRTRPPEPGLADYYTMWGVGFRLIKNEFTSYDEPSDRIYARMQTMDDVLNFAWWPDVNDCDFSNIEASCDQLADYAVTFALNVPDLVNSTAFGRGMEQVLVDIMTEDEVGVAIIDKRTDFYYEYCRRGLEAGKGKIDILWMGEDCGTQRGRLFPPEVFDRFFVPRLKKFIDLAHEHGALALLHSCGDTHEIMPTFIDMGLDILDSMQPEPAGMDPATIKHDYGDRLTFCGLVSTQQTLPHGTVQEVREEVRHRLDVVGKGGGYILAPAHTIEPDVPVENVLAMYAEALGLEEL